MSYRSDVSGLASQDVEHAHPIVAGGDLVERADAHVVLEAADALLEHCVFSKFLNQHLPQAAATTGMRSFAATSSRPPALIQASAARAWLMTSLMSESKPNSRYGRPSASSGSRRAPMPRP